MPRWEKTASASRPGKATSSPSARRDFVTNICYGRAMTEETENLVLEILRKVRTSQDRTEQDVSDLKARMSSVEHLLGQQQVQLAALNARLDRTDERLTRIERRLELVDA